MADSLVHVLQVRGKEHPLAALLVGNDVAQEHPLEKHLNQHEDALDAFLGQRGEAATLDAAQRRKLSAAFLTRLVGLDTLRVLLGLEGASDAEQLDRAKAATAELLSALPPRP